MEDKIICPLCGKEMTERTSVTSIYPKIYSYKCTCNKDVTAIKKIFKNTITIEYSNNGTLLNVIIKQKNEGIKKRYYLVAVKYFDVNIKDFTDKYYKIYTNNIYEQIGKKYMQHNVRTIYFTESVIESYLDPEETLNDRRIDVLDCKDNIEMFLNDSPTVGQRS